MESTTRTNVVVAVVETYTDQQPLAQQVRILYTQSVTTFLFPLLAAFCITAILRDFIDDRFLLVWLSIILLHGLLRYYLLWCYFHSSNREEHTDTWMNRFIITVLVSGVLWGFAGIFLIPYRSTDTIAFTLYNGLLLLTTCGLVAGAVISYAINIRVLVCYSLPALLPPAFHLISIGDRYNTSFGGLLLLYYLYILIAAIRMNRQFVYFMNMELQKEQLEQKYCNLKRIYEALRCRTPRAL